MNAIRVTALLFFGPLALGIAYSMLAVTRDLGTNAWWLGNGFDLTLCLALIALSFAPSRKIF